MAVPTATWRDPNQRIVCLTEEPTELLYLLGESQRIVGISVYTVRPPEAARDKPKVTAFRRGSLAKITKLKPDLVIGFSDIQAAFASELIAAGLQVVIFNQRSVSEILDVIVSIGRLVGAEERAQMLASDFDARIAAVRQRSEQRATRPRVYFEEWPDPIITGIHWVSELIEIAGGQDIFGDLRDRPLAKERIVQAQDVLERAPDVVLASWCGKPFDRAAFEARPGYEQMPAVKHGRVHAIDPAIILQPGPGAILEGLPLLETLIARAT